MSIKLTPLEHRVGASWAANKTMIDLFASPEVIVIARKVSEERLVREIYPSQENVFRAFRETPLSTVRVVWIAQSPHSSPGQATGLAMDCGKHTNPIIDKILEVYNNDFPQSFNTDLMDGKLIQWAHQGVFLYNTALTVIKNAPNSHLELWEPFTKGVLKTLIYDQNPKVFIGLGKPAQLILGNIPGPHTLLKYEHPTDAVQQERMWEASGIFHEINKIIKFYGRPEIDW